MNRQPGRSKSPHCWPQRELRAPRILPFSCSCCCSPPRNLSLPRIELHETRDRFRTVGGSEAPRVQAGRAVLARRATQTALPRPRASVLVCPKLRGLFDAVGVVLEDHGRLWVRFAAGAVEDHAPPTELVTDCREAGLIVDLDGPRREPTELVPPGVPHDVGGHDLHALPKGLPLRVTWSVVTVHGALVSRVRARTSL